MKKQLLVLSLLGMIATSGSVLGMNNEGKKDKVEHIIFLSGDEKLMATDLKKKRALFQKVEGFTEKQLNDKTKDIDKDIININKSRIINGLVKKGDTFLNWIKTYEKINDSKTKAAYKINKVLKKENVDESLENVKSGLFKYALTSITLAALYLNGNSVLKGFGMTNPLKELIGQNFGKISAGLFYGITGILGLDSLRGLFAGMKLSSLHNKIEGEKLINFVMSEASEKKNNENLAPVVKDLQKKLLVIDANNKLDENDKVAFVIGEDEKITKGDDEYEVSGGVLKLVEKKNLVVEEKN